jgi:DNA-binding transcriptional regulator YdaS (Cro superfamily)
MKLQDYLNERKVNVSAWCKEADIPQPVISRFLAGIRGVSLRTALKIEAATDGAVTVEDMVKQEDG